MLLALDMDDIPVSFEWQGKEYARHFSVPHDAGGNVWFLTVNKYHWGQLILTQNYGWAFHNNKNEMKELADYFGDVVTAWYQ